MKFSWKVFICTLAVVSITFSLGSTLLLASWFSSALEREVSLAQEENRLLRFSLENAAASLPAYPQSDLEQLIHGVMTSLARTSPGATSARLLQVDGALWYDSGSAWVDTLSASQGDAPAAYIITQQQDRYLIQYRSTTHLYGQSFHLETQRDATALFTQRLSQQERFTHIMLILAGSSSLLLFLLARWLTRPIGRLAAVTRKMAQGDYSVRAPVKGGDEMSILADSFNTMAQNLECHMNSLKESLQRQEEFSSAFAHEVKTPLTSIIGYADLLRSRQLSPQQRMEASNYIYQEGRRLESLSFKLLDLMVLGRRDFQYTPLNMPLFLQQVGDFASQSFAQSNIQFQVEPQEGTLVADPDLLKTLCLNLLENARRATPAGGKVSLTGAPSPQGYCLRVIDTGTGIPPHAKQHLTQAFYRVDKARSREHGGAGLGLALCAKITELHRGELSFSDAPGGGTIVTVELKGGQTHEEE